MADTPITFGDSVRVIATPETKNAGLAGLSGQVYGHTTPSVTNVDVIGNVTDDFAINVHFDERDESFWLVSELLEFIDHGAGTEITFDGVAKKWTRKADGGWDESPTAEHASKKPGFLARLFGHYSENHNNTIPPDRPSRG